MSYWKQNWPYWLAAIVMAIALNTYVRMEESPRTRSLEVPILFTNASPDFIITPSRRLVTVTVRGPQDIIQRMTPKDISAVVDLRGLTPGSAYTLDVQCSSKVSPDSVTCAPSPAVVVVSIDVRESKPLPITARLTGAPPVGFEFERPIVTPAEATVSGLSRAVSRVERLLVIVPMGQTNIDRQLPIQPVDSRGAPVPGVKITPSTARVVARIRRAPLAKNLVVSIVVSGHPDSGYAVTDLTVKPIMVKARGDARLATLSTVQTVPIPLDGLKETTTIRVPLERLPGIELNPDVVSVKVEIKRIAPPPIPEQGGKEVGQAVRD